MSQNSCRSANQLAGDQRLRHTLLLGRLICRPRPPATGQRRGEQRSHRHIHHRSTVKRPVSSGTVSAPAEAAGKARRNRGAISEARRVGCIPSAPSNEHVGAIGSAPVTWPNWVDPAARQRRRDAAFFDQGIEYAEQLRIKGPKMDIVRASAIRHFRQRPDFSAQRQVAFIGFHNQGDSVMTRIVKKWVGNSAARQLSRQPQSDNLRLLRERPIRPFKPREWHSCLRCKIIICVQLALSPVWRWIRVASEENSDGKGERALFWYRACCRRHF